MHEVRKKKKEKNCHPSIYVCMLKHDFDKKTIKKVE